MIVIKKLFALFAFALLATGAHARFSVFDNTGACEIAKANSLVTGYVPTTDSPFKPTKGWTRHVVGAGGACLGGAYVMEDGVPVKGKAVYVAPGFVYWRQDATGALRMDKCNNHFEEIVLLGKEEPIARPAPVPAPAPVVAAPTVVETTIKENKTFDANYNCKLLDGSVVPVTVVTAVHGKCPQITIDAPVSVNEQVNVQPHVVQTPQVVRAKQVPQARQEQGCAGCVPHEEVKVTREEKRTDGRCFVKTNMGYMFEIRANASNGRLMAAMVNPSTEQKVEGTQALYVGNELASKNSQGFDCDGMQAQLYKHWEPVRTAYGLPSACKLATSPATIARTDAAPARYVPAVR